MMKLRMLVSGMMVLGLMFGAGCRKSANDVPDSDSAQTEVVPEPLTMEMITAEIEKVKSGDGHDAVIVRLKEMVSSDEYAPFKMNIARMLIDEYLAEEEISFVQNAFLKLAAEDEDIARAGYGKVMQASTTTNSADVAAWYEKILVSPVSDSMKGYTWQLLVQSYSDAESIQPLVERLDEILSLSEPGASFGVIRVIISVGLKTGDYEGLANLIAAVRERAADKTELVHLMLQAEADVLLQQGQLEKTAEFLSLNAEALGDSALHRLTVKALHRCAADKNDALAAKLVENAYAGGNKYPSTRNAVALILVRNAGKSKKPELFLSQIKRAIDAGVSVPQLIAVLRDGFYMVMTAGNAEYQKSCMELVAKLNGEDGLSESTHQSLALLLLDGAFYQNDFRAAYKVIKDGVPGYDEKWHEEMADKVGAHLALQEGRSEDAIALFRKHMARVEAWTEPVINPTNGARMTREAVMGFNEKRIGDIYSKMDGHAEDAKASYLKSREWYNKAIAAAKPGSIERKIAEEELAQIP